MVDESWEKIGNERKGPYKSLIKENEMLGRWLRAASGGDDVLRKEN